MGRYLSFLAPAPAGRRAAAGLLMLILMSAAMVAVPSTAAAQRSGTLTVVGRGNSSLVVTVTSRVRLGTDMLDPMGGPGYGEPLPTPYFGFAFSRLRDGRVVAGWIRSRYLENTLGVYANLPVGVGQVLRPGRYRLTLFGRGRTRVVLHPENLTGSITWKTRRRTPVRFAMGPLEPSQHRPYLLERRSAVNLTRPRYVGFGEVNRL